jgi:hypothetical protein
MLPALSLSHECPQQLWPRRINLLLIKTLLYLMQGQSQGLAAEWAEELSLDVSPEGLAAADALLLLEVLQLPSGFARFKVWSTAN